MMKEEDRIFSEIYSLDAATNCYMIEIGLDHYIDMFNEWDPAPFKRRSIDVDLELYLEGSSEEIPLQYPVELYFTVPAAAQNDQLEAESRSGLKNSFTFKLYLLQRELRKINTQMLRCALLGFVLLGVGKFALNQVGDTGLVSLLADALVIGGWVFLWESVSLFFFTNRELYYRYRLYKRLHDAPVIFRAVETDSSTRNQVVQQ
jgi:TM2 domain-containing membrane protein YozV